MSDKFRYTAGLNNVGSYQVSGKTFITASTVNDGEEDQIEFPDVTNNIKVKLDSAGGVIKKTYAINGQFQLRDNSLTSPNNYQNITFVMWLKVNKIAPNAEYMTTTPIRLLFKPNNNRITLRCKDADDAFPNVSFQDIDVSNVHHYVLTLDHDVEAKLYVDGVLKATIDLSSVNSVTTAASVFSLGSAGNDTGLEITEAAIFDTTFNPTQVQEAYNSGNYFDLTNHSQNASLSHYWLFGDSDGDTFDNNPSGLGTNIQATVVDTIGSDDLIALSQDGDDEIAEGTHTFGGGGGELRIHYRSKDYNNVISQKHYWTLDSQYESIKMNVKSKELYLSADGGNCDYSISAELTNIPTSSMFQHTGSGVDE
jgi:hypothetical protein